MSPSHRIYGVNKLSLRAHRTRRLTAIRTHERASNKGKDEVRQHCLQILGHVLYYPHQKCKRVFLTVPQTGDTSQWLPLLSIILDSKEALKKPLFQKKPVTLNKPLVSFAAQSLIQDRPSCVVIYSIELEGLGWGWGGHGESPQGKAKNLS